MKMLPKSLSYQSSTSINDRFIQETVKKGIIIFLYDIYKCILSLAPFK